MLISRQEEHLNNQGGGFLSKFTGLRLVLLGAIGLVAIFVFFSLCGKSDGPTGQEVAISQARGFLEHESQSLPEGERYSIVKLSGPTYGWVLLTVRRTTESFGDKTGTEGLLAIGEEIEGKYNFSLQGDSGFDAQLRRLPERLLPYRLRPFFLSDENHQSVSRVAPGKPSSNFTASAVTFHLPYPKGESYRVSTLPGDRYHTGSIYHAIDFDMPDGSPLVPIAIAKVRDFRDNSNAGGCDPSFADDANYIRLEINPETTVLYLHTQPGSITEASVKKGDTVAPGQVIAKVGHTGFTCNWEGTGPGAHLHIVLEKWCGSQSNRYICGSLPLNFAEIPDEPEYGKAYVSENAAPKKEGAESAAETAEIEQIKDAIDAFHEVFRCSSLKACDQSTLLRYSVTEGLWQQLFPESSSFCISGCGVKWDKSKVTYNELLLFEPPQGDSLTVTTKETWVSQSRELKYGEITHYTVVDHYLVRRNGIWLVDGHKIVCGYTTDEKGQMIPEEETIEEENLDGCLWQPKNGSNH